AVGVFQGGHWGPLGACHGFSHPCKRSLEHDGERSNWTALLPISQTLRLHLWGEDFMSNGSRTEVNEGNEDRNALVSFLASAIGFGLERFSRFRLLPYPPQAGRRPFVSRFPCQRTRTRSGRPDKRPSLQEGCYPGTARAFE